MSSRKFTAIGVDVGGTKMAFGIVTFPVGVVHSIRTIPTLPERGGAAVFADVQQVVTELAREVREPGGCVDGIGVGVCELVGRNGLILSKSCFDWTVLPVIETLSSIAPTVLEADVRAAARAEARFGAGRNFSVVLYISIGTGISSCLVIDGEPHLGNLGATGTMASGPLPRACAPEGTADPISLEQIASGPALVSQYRALRGKANCAEEVMAAAHAGDESARMVIHSAAEALGGSIGWLVNVLDPGIVILGGGLGAAESRFREWLVDSTRRHIWWNGHRELPIWPAQTGVNAGMIGAAASAWNHFARGKSPKSDSGSSSRS